jgi:hypothetical protein
MDNRFGPVTRCCESKGAAVDRRPGESTGKGGARGRTADSRRTEAQGVKLNCDHTSSSGPSMTGLGVKPAADQGRTPVAVAPKWFPGMCQHCVPLNEFCGRCGA